MVQKLLATLVCVVVKVPSTALVRTASSSLLRDLAHGDGANSENRPLTMR